MRQWNFIVRGITLLLAGAAARADLLYLNDGRVFEGVVVRSIDGSASIDTMIGTIRTTLVFSRREIARIEDRELPEDHFSASASVPSAAEPRAAIDASSTSKAPAPQPPTYYLEAPIVGVFGSDVLPIAVEKTLEFAVKRGIEHVVFFIDSPGGEVWAADAIASLLEEYEHRLTYHAVVERAMSAAIWVALSCDNIFVTPSSAMGAAVVYQRNETSGSAAVDAKMISAYAAILGGIAEDRGRPAAIARAMVSMDAELYSWVGGDGVRRFSAEPPAQSSYETLDTQETVLTLTGHEMLRLGIAEGRTTSCDGVGEQIGENAWKQPTAFGVATARRFADLAKSAQSAIAACQRVIEAEVTAAQQQDPRSYSYSTDADGEFSPSSLARWRERADRCYVAWHRVHREAIALGSAIDDAEEAGLPLPLDELRRQQQDWKKDSSRMMAEMKNLRRRTGR